MRTVVLASGGIDSTLMMALLSQEGHEIEPLFIDYAQRAAEAEWRALQDVCTELELPAPTRFSIQGCEILGSALTTEKKSLKTEAFLPTRNLLFLVSAAGFAHSIGAPSVAIGLVESPRFPDQTEDFVRRAEDAIEASIGEQVRVLTPLLDIDKREVLRLAVSEELPLSRTYSCHAGTSEPCGDCIACDELTSAISALEEENAEAVDEMPANLRSVS